MCWLTEKQTDEWAQKILNVVGCNYNLWEYTNVELNEMQNTGK